MAFDPSEIAVVEVNGRTFTDWTSVLVETEYANWFPKFQFDCSEEGEMPTSWNKLQLAPGDVAKVYLGGELAVFGYLIERHVAFEKRHHAVRLVGTGKTFDLTNSCVPLDKLGGHDGKTWSQLAQDLIQHLGLKLKKVGAVDDEKFENIQVQPGETISQILERYARMRKIVIGSSHEGDLVAIGDHSGTVAGYLTEGDNILRANGVIRDENVYRKIYTIGQQNSNDEHSGDKSNKQIGRAMGSSNRDRYLIIPTEIADGDHGVQQRAEMEKIFTEGAQIEFSITVQGWKKPGGSLWRAGEYYFVKSPALITNRLLGCKSCVYEQQDGGGTTTTLQMVDPVHMNGRPNMSGTISEAPQ